MQTISCLSLYDLLIFFGIQPSTVSARDRKDKHLHLSYRPGVKSAQYRKYKKWKLQYSIAGKRTYPRSHSTMSHAPNVLYTQRPYN